MGSISWEVWAILLPLAAAALTFLCGPRAARILVPVAVPTVSTTVLGLTRRVWLDGPLHHEIGGWSAPLGIELYADGLSVSMLLATAVIISLAGTYALGTIREGKGRSEGCESDYFWPLWLFLWATLNAVFLSRDIFNLYITLELLGLCAVPLLILKGSGTALTSGMRYLLVAMLASTVYLLGVVFLYAAFGTLSLSDLGTAVRSAPAAWIAVSLITVALLLKTALFPLHFWLPTAHGNAPTPVSALLSGLVVKAAFYLLIRLWFQVFAGVIAPVAGQVLGILGSAAILWGSLAALRQKRLKLLIAYSTVAQIGYLYLLFPLAVTSVPATGDTLHWENTARAGTVYFMISHGCAKAAMFMAAGCMAQAVGSDRIEEILGVGRHLPLCVAAFALAGVSLMGLPPSGGFTSKWMLLSAAFGCGQWWWAVVMNAGGLLAAAYVFPVIRRTLVYRPVDIRFYPVPMMVQVSAFTMALVSLLLGLSGSFPFMLLEIGSPLAAMPVGEGGP